MKTVGSCYLYNQAQFWFGLLLLALLQKPNDRDHKVKVAIGNGLRGDVWREFTRRFGDIHIYEFYASTEGNVGFLNYPRKVGAVGKVNYLQRVSTQKSQSVCTQLPDHRHLLIFHNYWKGIDAKSWLAPQKSPGRQAHSWKPKNLTLPQWGRRALSCCRPGHVYQEAGVGARAG